MPKQSLHHTRRDTPLRWCLEALDGIALDVADEREAIPALRPGMLCLADRNFFGFAL